jgi:two-component system chemotaxis response regulator CheB
VLFESVAAAYGNHSLAVIMTGMGRDGAAELGTIRRRGGITIGQDEASSVVYGMPKVAYEMGHVEYQLPLHEIASKMAEIVREQNG